MGGEGDGPRERPSHGGQAAHVAERDPGARRRGIVRMRDERLHGRVIEADPEPHGGCPATGHDAGEAGTVGSHGGGIGLAVADAVLQLVRPCATVVRRAG